jgi:hypothetical protein
MEKHIINEKKYLNPSFSKIPLLMNTNFLEKKTQHKTN